MLAAFFVFVIVTGSIIAGYFAAAQLPDLLAARRLNRRLREVSMDLTAAAEQVGDGSLVKRVVEGPLPAVDRLVVRVKAGARLARLIDQSGVRTTGSAVVLASLAIGAVAAFVAGMFSANRLVMPVAGIAGCALPVLWLTHRRKVRFRLFEEQFPEALDMLSRAIRAGHAFQTAMGMVADELTEPVGPEFKKTFDQQNFGLPLREALNELSDRINSLDVRFFVTAVLIQRDTGGNLSEILDNLAHVVRERFKILRQVRVHTAHGRFTGYVLLALPAFLAVALMFINPDHMSLLFKERMGQMMVMGAIVMQTIGFFWIRQVIKIEV